MIFSMLRTSNKVLPVNVIIVEHFKRRQHSRLFNTICTSQPHILTTCSTLTLRKWYLLRNNNTSWTTFFKLHMNYTSSQILKEAAKRFFVKYITQYFQKHDKIIILSATTGAATLKLSKSASIVHIIFRIPTHGYLFVLPV